MRVAFINVNLKDGELRDQELEFYNHKCSIELGTLYLDANANWRPDDEVVHINMLKLALTGRDWRTVLTDFRPDVVAISALSYYEPELFSTSREAKQATGAWIIAGGPHVTAVGAEVLDEPAIDFALAGEGESGFRAFIEYFRGDGVELNSIPGLIWRDSGKTYANARNAEDINSLSFPRIGQVDPFEYSGFTSILNLKIPHMPIVTTRGCPYKCVYCHEIMGKNIRYRSVDSVLAEVDYWRAAGIDTFLINDDIFNIHRKRAQEIFREFATREGMRIAFPNGLRADLLDRETVDLFIEGGMFYAMVAVESGDAAIQKHIKKNLHLEKVFEMIEYMGSAGVIIGSFNIFGFPGETEADIERTIAFNEKTTGLTKANFFILNPHKGTEVYNMALEEGYMPPEGAIQGYFNVHSTSPTRNVCSDRLSEMRAEAYRRFYLTPARLDHVLEASARNVSAADRLRFHQIDYSYVLNQFIGIDRLSDYPDLAVRERLLRLLPDGAMQSY